MWKKNESKSASPQPQGPATGPRVAAPPSQGASAARIATIGPSISIKGDICGEGDLLIEGRVEGGIQLRQHDVTIGRSGRVEADVHGKRICVEGQVKGDLFGEEVVIRKSGRVEGNATAPRVSLEDGCNFRGEINMRPAGSAAKPRRQAVPRAAHSMA